jgi:hypothetical protein
MYFRYFVHEELGAIGIFMILTYSVYKNSFTENFPVDAHESSNTYNKHSSFIQSAFTSRNEPSLALLEIAIQVVFESICDAPAVVFGLHVNA